VQERHELMKKISAELSGAPDAHSLLVAIYQHPETPLELKLDAAISALRVEKPALAAAAVKVEDVTFAKELDEACRRVGLIIDSTAEPAS
jgi:hypothetical protein